MTRRRVPNAMLTVRVLQDPDFVELTAREGGFAAFGIFCALLALAKDLEDADKNSRPFDRETGAFPGTLRAVARSIGCEVAALQNAVELIGTVCADNKSSPWLVIQDGHLIMPRFGKYHPERTETNHGGPRPGAGRKPKQSPYLSSGNQVENLKTNQAGNQESRPRHSETETETETESETGSLSPDSPSDSSREACFERVAPTVAAVPGGLSGDDLDAIERFAHDLYPPFDGKPRITPAQMLSLLEAVKRCGDFGAVRRACERAFQSPEKPGVGAFVRRVASDTARVINAARRTGGGHTPSPDRDARNPQAIAAKWREADAVRTAPPRFDNGPSMCLIELASAGCGEDEAERLLRDVFGDERAMKAIKKRRGLAQEVA